jgi:DNA-packaging protein gp3
MARPKGTKYIETPEKMWELFTEYKAFCKDNPFIVTDWVGGMAKQVNRKKERPLTLEGFENYCFENGILNDLADYFSNKEQRYTDYAAICSRIRKVIREEQISGGMAGIYNPSITQRLNNLVEKTENKHEVSEIVIKRES